MQQDTRRKLAQDPFVWSSAGPRLSWSLSLYGVPVPRPALAFAASGRNTAAWPAPSPAKATPIKATILSSQKSDCGENPKLSMTMGGKEWKGSGNSERQGALKLAAPSLRSTEA